MSVYEQMFAQNAAFFGLLAILVIPLKGYALWTSAKRNEKWWFIALLIINTVGILELIYLLAFAKVQEKWQKSPSAAKDGGKPTMPDAPKEDASKQE